MKKRHFRCLCAAIWFTFAVFNCRFIRKSNGNLNNMNIDLRICWNVFDLFY